MAASARTRKRSLLRRGRDPDQRGRSGARITGSARLGRRTKDLVKRLGPADIAIIDHADLDRIAAEELIASGVPAVVNVARYSTGRYPNAGPLMLAEASVQVVDASGAGLFEQLSDGEPIDIEAGSIYAGGELLVKAQVLTAAELSVRLDQQRERIDSALAAFAENTAEHARQEGELLTGAIEFPALRTRCRDRHALIVARGANHRNDLRTLNAYIRDVRPVLIGVDGGADAILATGRRPDIVLGDMDSASDAALRCGAELVVHAYPDGTAPGRERLVRMELEHEAVPAPGTSQDVAMLLAFEKGASLIVSVGAHFNLEDFLDRGRDGMSSTFLTRLRIGETLVDAKGVSRLYRPEPRRGQIAFFLGAFVVLLAIVILTSPALDNLLELLWLRLRVTLGL
ncbi:MAG: putative cytokinetic ring protein SteA [Solirubrobacterales bacterium]